MPKNRLEVQIFKIFWFFSSSSHVLAMLCYSYILETFFFEKFGHFYIWNGFSFIDQKTWSPKINFFKIFIFMMARQRESPGRVIPEATNEIIPHSKRWLIWDDFERKNSKKNNWEKLKNISTLLIRTRSGLFLPLWIRSRETCAINLLKNGLKLK